MLLGSRRLHSVKRRAKRRLTQPSYNLPLSQPGVGSVFALGEFSRPIQNVLINCAFAAIRRQNPRKSLRQTVLKFDSLNAALLQ
jgi:hypothetical protein